MKCRSIVSAALGCRAKLSSYMCDAVKPGERDEVFWEMDLHNRIHRPQMSYVELVTVVKVLS